MLSKVCGSGLEHMYVYDDNGDEGLKLKPVKPDDLKKLSLHVFEGNFSCCALKHNNCTRCDKQELAIPVLGLYSLVLTHRSQPHMAEVAQLIEQDKAKFFPSHIDFISGANGENNERRPLLDELVEVMEKHMGVKPPPRAKPDTSPDPQTDAPAHAADALESNAKPAARRHTAAKKSRVYVAPSDDEAVIN